MLRLVACPRIAAEDLFGNGRAAGILYGDGGGPVVFDDILPSALKKEEDEADPHGWSDLLGVWHAIQQHFPNFRYFEYLQDFPGVGVAVRLAKIVQFKINVTSMNSPVISQSNINSDRQSGKSPNNLPDKPIVIIESRRRSSAINLYDLWQYRDLLYILTLRDIKVRYKQTVLGILWVVIQPLFMMIVFTLFFGKLAGMPSDGIPYPLFAYAGLLPWTFFSNALNNSGNSLVGNSNLITKVYFPRMIIPIAAVGAGLIDFVIASGLLILLMVYYGIGFSPNILMLPILTLLTAFLAIGLGMWMSALNVKYRDIRYALPFALQLWMFATPIIYPSSLVPNKWRWLLMLNPLTGLIEAYRSAIFGKPFDLTGLGISIFIISIVLVCSAYTFRHMERSFADIV